MLQSGAADPARLPDHPFRASFHRIVDSRLSQGQNAMVLDHWAEARQRPDLLDIARRRKMPATLIQPTPEIRDRDCRNCARLILQEPFDIMQCLRSSEALTTVVIQEPAR